MVANARNDQPRSFQVWNAIAASPNDFNLDAGLYGLTVTASAWGTATLQKLLPDGVTYVPVNAAILAGNGYVTIQLPAGQYGMLLAGITAFSGVIEKIDAGRAR